MAEEAMLTAARKRAQKQAPPRSRQDGARSDAQHRRSRPSALRGPSAALFERVRKRPVRAAALSLFSLLLCGIVVNAVVLQTGRHPAPLFASAPGPSASPPHPVAPPAASPSVEASSDAAAPTKQPAPLAKQTAPVSPPPAAGHLSPPRKDADPIAKLVASSDPLGDLIAREVPKGDEPKRVHAAQQALSKLGFSVKVSGRLDSETKVALERFEKMSNLPVSDVITPRVARALSARSGLRIN